MADISTQLRVSNLMEQALSLFDGEEEQQIVIQYLEHAAANHICMQDALTSKPQGQPSCECCAAASGSNRPKMIHSIPFSRLPRRVLKLVLFDMKHTQRQVVNAFDEDEGDEYDDSGASDTSSGKKLESLMADIGALLKLSKEELQYLQTPVREHEEGEVNVGLNPGLGFACEVEAHCERDQESEIVDEEADNGEPKKRQHPASDLELASRKRMRMEVP